MAKVKVRVTADDVENAGNGGEFDLPPAGFYTATLEKCEAGYKKAEGGGEDKDAPRLECTYVIDGIGREGKPLEAKGMNFGKLWDYVTFSEASGWKRVEFLKAMGLPVPDKGGEFEVDTDEVEDTRVVVRVKHEKDRQADDGSKRARISNVFPFVDADAEAAFGADAPSGEGVAFGGDEDDAPETGGDGDIVEPWTKEELEALELKELGEAAGEFDIDPKPFAKKVRGKMKVDKEGLIAAILEAQGDDGDEDGADASGDTDDDESPF